uniref:LBH domain-containing protein n=1 Tax=Terrapene triunguis TaxID=2587831 RepID=A0A674JCG8_9SAUR
MAEGTRDCGGAPSQGVLTPGEACTPIQLPVATPGRNSLSRPHSTDQEMQWLSEVGRSLIQTDPVQGKARLPSIVVEPTETGEVESGELRWPPDDFLLLEGEDETKTVAES